MRAGLVMGERCKVNGSEVLQTRVHVSCSDAGSFRSGYFTTGLRRGEERSRVLLLHGVIGKTSAPGAIRGGQGGQGEGHGDRGREEGA